MKGGPKSITRRSALRGRVAAMKVVQSDCYRQFVDQHLTVLVREARVRYGLAAQPLTASGHPCQITQPHQRTLVSPDIQRFARASVVSTWLRLAQLLTVADSFFLSRMLSLGSARLRSILNFENSTLIESRVIWLCWSSFFCPSNLESGFHHQTFGFFNDKDTGDIRLFELERVRNGYDAAEFLPYRPITDDPMPHYGIERDLLGVIRYGVEGRWVRTDPPAPLKCRGVDNPEWAGLNDDQLRKIISLRNLGWSQNELAEEFRVAQPYISLLLRDWNHLFECFKELPQHDVDLEPLRDWLAVY